MYDRIENNLKKVPKGQLDQNKAAFFKKKDHKRVAIKPSGEKNSFNFQLLNCNA